MPYRVIGLNFCGSCIALRPAGTDRHLQKPVLATVAISCAGRQGGGSPADRSVGAAGGRWVGWAVAFAGRAAVGRWSGGRTGCWVVAVTELVLSASR